MGRYITKVKDRCGLYGLSRTKYRLLVSVIFSNVVRNFNKIHIFGDRYCYVTTVTTGNHNIATDTVIAMDTNILTMGYNVRCVTINKPDQ